MNIILVHYAKCSNCARMEAHCLWAARPTVAGGRARQNRSQGELDAGCPTLNTGILTTELWGLGKACLLLDKLFSFWL